MIATLSFAALAGCGSKSIAKNDETTISDTVKQTQKQTEKNTEVTAKSTAKNDETTVSDTVKQTQKQTEKAADVITDAAKESTSAEKVTTEAGSTEAEVSGDAIVATEPANEVAKANEPSYKPATEPDTPAYEPTDTASADTPADDTPAPAEPAVHEHNWVPVYGYIEWIENETGENTHRRYIDENSNEVVITKHDFGNEGWLIDHYECECGETKTGEDHEKIESYKNTKQISKDGLFYYKTTEEFSVLYKNTQRMKENLIS